MALIHIQGVGHRFGGQPLLEGVDLPLDRGERVCLVGRNGSGKTTLMKIISGELEPDTGQVARTPGLTTVRLEQEIPQDWSGSILEVTAAGLGAVGRLLGAYQRAARSDDLDQLGQLQQELDRTGAWGARQRVETVLTRMGLDGDLPFETLSGGLKRRVLLARCLVTDPDLLLLDEPTNHLDLPSIEWLENTLVGFRGAVLFITHDRALARRLATRVVALDRGRLLSYPGGFDDFLRRQEAALEAEERQQAVFDRKLAQEEVWIRQGIKARRTRNMGRVRALQTMRRERLARRERTGQARLAIQEAAGPGRLVVEAEDVHYSYADVPCIRGLTTTILRGDKVGLIGPNGCGKTTLLQILLGRLPPDRGRLLLGTRLEVAYFDQSRAQLDPEASVADSVANGRQQIQVGERSRHVISYLGDFLFPPDRARSPVKVLSGGERNRLLLARLFARPANLLVLDEPTNDLDADTLELLEILLVEFSGTVLLVSHDRTFLDNVVTSLLVFEGGGRLEEHVGGYGDWLRQRLPAPEAVLPATRPRAAAEPTKPPARTDSKKLTYAERLELADLPQRIETLEDEQARLHATMADPLFFKQDRTTVGAAQARLTAVEQELAALYGRWEELESRG
ncbi:MAG: ATP-binding cassette domain-containing protein [Magnetococcales bacterium]|nr:ATP-binding cassette domain-containing protein [Magnetococcales bacterium]